MTYDPEFPADGEIENAASNEVLWTLLEQQRAAAQMCLGAPLGGLQEITLTAEGFLAGFSRAPIAVRAYEGTIGTVEGINPGGVPAGYVMAMTPISGHTIIVKHASAAAGSSMKVYLQGAVDWEQGMFVNRRQWLLVMYMGATLGWYEIGRCFGSSLDDFREFYGVLPITGGTVLGNISLAGEYNLLVWNTAAVTLLSTDHALSLIGAHGALAVGTYDGLPAIQCRTAYSEASDLHLQPHGGDVIVNDAGTGGKLWHAGNDGAGSGLDADTLDGREATALVDPPYISLADLQASGGYVAQALTQTTWTKRNVSTEVYDTGSLCALADSVITLAAGTYECRIICPVDGETGVHRARLRNTTAGATLLSSVNTSGDAPAIIEGRFTIGAEQDLEIQHYVSGASVTTGGELENGEDEVLTTAVFRYLS